MLAGWLLAALPRVARAAPPEPVFGPPSAQPFGLTDVGKDAAPALVDLDGDGDRDAVVGSLSGDLEFFRNTGSAVHPDFAAASPNPFSLTNVTPRAKPALADLDGDGDLDALVGRFTDGFSFFRNTGSTTSPAFATPSLDPFSLATAGFDSAPALADIDGDGDLDTLAGEYYGDLHFFRNTGSSANPTFTPGPTNPFGLSNVGAFAHAAPTFVDLDGDGDLDVEVGLAKGGTSFFRNTGTALSPAFAAPRANAFGIGYAGMRAIPFFIDIDGDGDLDGFAGNYAGDVLLFRGLTSQLLFEDGFESGGFGPWSAHSP
jgi:hypothetical protein